jgi:hypothetical protein
MDVLHRDLNCITTIPTVQSHFDTTASIGCQRDPGTRVLDITQTLKYLVHTAIVVSAVEAWKAAVEQCASEANTVPKGTCTTTNGR